MFCWCLFHLWIISVIVLLSDEVPMSANEEVSMWKKRKTVIDPSTHIAIAFVQVSLFS